MTNMRKKAAITVVVVCGGVSVGSALATADSGAPAAPSEAKVEALRSAYPSLRASSPATARNGSTVVASARLARSDGTPVEVTANDDGTMCLVTDGAGTCRSGDIVAREGLFLAAVDCKRGQASVFGVTPHGATVSRVVTAPGTQSDVATGSGGVVTIEASGLDLAGVNLSNGASAKIPLSDKICGPAAP